MRIDTELVASAGHKLLPSAEREQRGVGNVLGVHFEVSAQGVARVAAAEAVRAERHHLARQEPRDLLRNQPNPITRGHEGPGDAVQHLFEIGAARRIRPEPPLPLHRQRIASQEALEKWWRAPVRILSTNAARLALQVDLTVLPFSAAEEEDAREWMTKSGGVGTAGGGAGALVDILIGTTLSAKPITSYRWHVDLTLR